MEHRSKWGGSVVGLLACVGLVVAAGIAVAGLRKATVLSAAGFFRNFDAMVLVDQRGRPFEPSALAGRIVLVNFVYTGCSTACPLQTYALAEVQRQLPESTRRHVRLLSVSLDPLQDTPAALTAYATRMGADVRDWSFVTGRAEDADRVAAALRLYGPSNDARRPDGHATAVWLVDPDGRVVVRYDGNPPDVARIVRELRQLAALKLGASV